VKVDGKIPKTAKLLHKALILEMYQQLPCSLANIERRLQVIAIKLSVTKT